MTESKRKSYFCQYHRLFHNHSDDGVICEGQRIVDEFETKRKKGEAQPGIDFKKEIPLPE
jgi:hypothetical protein